MPDIYSECLLAHGSALAERDEDGAWWTGPANHKPDEAFDVETRKGLVTLTLWCDQYWYAGDEVSGDT